MRVGTITGAGHQELSENRAKSFLTAACRKGWHGSRAMISCSLVEWHSLHGNWLVLNPAMVQAKHAGSHSVTRVRDSNSNLGHAIANPFLRSLMGALFTTFILPNVISMIKEGWCYSLTPTPPIYAANLGGLNKYLLGKYHCRYSRGVLHVLRLEQGVMDHKAKLTTTLLTCHQATSTLWGSQDPLH